MPYVKISGQRLLHLLDDNAISIKCRDHFWDLYMPQADCVEDEHTLNWGHPMQWLGAVNKLPAQESSLKNAFSALIVARVSKENRDQGLAEASTLLYGSALQHLQSALHDPERVYTDEVLIASLLLAVYEAFQGSSVDSSSWLSHALGAGRLIELRGPERHQTRQPHQAFLASRITTIYAAILQRKACYLATEEWRNVPWESQQRSYFDRLVDIATGLPSLLERIDCVSADSPTSREQETKTVLEELLSMQKAMNSWKRYLKKEAAAEDIKPTTTDEQYPFDTKHWFDNHVFANAASLYHTYSLVISEAVEELSDPGKAAYGLRMKTREGSDAQYHATCITKMVPYCLQPDMGGLGRGIINCPVTLAVRYFHRTGNAAVATWLTSVFNSTVSHESDHDDNMYDIRKVQDEKDVGTLSPTTKSDSSDGTSDGPERAGPYDRRKSRVMVKFVYEDPSRHYSDMSGTLSQAEQLTLRSKRPP